jgi:hypothetical protein
MDFDSKSLDGETGVPLATYDTDCGVEAVCNLQHAFFPPQGWRVWDFSPCFQLCIQL